MCEFCVRMGLLPKPLFGKACLLTQGSGNNKPICCLVHNAYDEEDNATKFKPDCEHVTNNRDHKLLNINRLTLENWNFQKDIKNPAKVNIGKGPLYVSFQSHGAPGWTLGRGGVVNEYLAIEKLKTFVCELQQATLRPVTAIILRSCYSAVECEYQGRFMLSSARLVSILIPGVLVVGFFGSDNGSNKVTGLVDNKIINDDIGTASFFKGMPLEYTPSPLLFSKVIPEFTRNELRTRCLLVTNKLPLVLAQCTLDQVNTYVSQCRHEAYLLALAERARVHGNFRRQRAEHARQRRLRALQPVPVPQPQLVQLPPPQQVLPIQQPQAQLPPVLPQQQAQLLGNQDPVDSWENL